MISLKIQNLILIEKAEIIFGPGLNILTGETGSGKSAILSAIRLIAGERADIQAIRKGTDLAVVEALIGGIHFRRELHRSGKSRCFIDDELVNLATLKARGHFELIDQSSSLTLCSIEQQRQMLDEFAGIVEEVEAFSHSLTQQKEWEQFLAEHNPAELERMRNDLAFIEEVNVQPGEEERLSQEHHFLTHAQELLEKIGTVSFSLMESSEPLIPALKRSASTLDYCLKFDGGLAPLAESMKGAVLELEEVGRTIRNYCDRLEADPHRLNFIEKRMGAIESLKRRFGADIEAQRNKLIKVVDELESKVREGNAELEKIQKKNRAWEEKITEKRQSAAPQLAHQVLHELKSLNIPHAQFEIAVNGWEVRFLFSANPGIAAIPLEQCASGGELSRLLLAIKTILGSGTSTLVFDEIDSNVGGQTAAILGEKLKRLAEKRQVICVTHFVQVAKCATDHFLVTKVEKEGCATTNIAKLDPQSKQREYNRMLGNL